MLGPPETYRRQTDIYNLGAKYQARRKIPLARQGPLVLDKGARKNDAGNRSGKQRKRRQPQDASREQAQIRTKAKQLIVEENINAQEKESYLGGEVRHRINETLLTLQKQEAAFRDLDVSTFSQSQTEAWHDALVNLNQRTAEMVRAVEGRCRNSTEPARKAVAEEDREKRRKKEKTGRKKHRVHYDSRGWRIQPQPKPPSLQKTRSLPILPESTAAPTAERAGSVRSEAYMASQEETPPVGATPPPLPPQRAMPAPASGTQSCPAMPGRPPPVPRRPAPVDKVQQKSSVKLKPLKSGMQMSPLLSMLAEPYRQHRIAKHHQTGPPTEAAESAGNVSVIGTPHHQQLFISKVRAQRALGRLKTMQSLLANDERNDSVNPSTGLSHEGGAAAQDWRGEAGLESTPTFTPDSPGTVGTPSIVSPATASAPRVRFNVQKDSAPSITPQMSLMNSSSKKRGTVLLAEAITAASKQAQTEAEETLKREKCQKYRSEIFHKLRDDTDHEIHRDSLPKALELAGFSNPDQTWLAEVFNALTCYNTLSEDEFLRFVDSYAARQELAGEELFTMYDADKSGTIDLEELATLLSGCGITPMAHVIEETVREVVDADCERDSVQLSLEQTKRLMDILRQREGFCLEKYRIFIETFHRYNRSNTGEMKTQEVMGALGFLGYTLEPQAAQAVCDEVDIDGTGTINEREFIVLMRKVQEREIAKARAVFQESVLGYPREKGEIREVQEALKMLGYMTTKLAILEAAEDVGMYDLPDRDLTFDDFWCMLEVFRKREGFSREEADSIKTAFDTYDADKDGELTHLELGKALRQLGYVSNSNVQQKLVAEVDIDGSGSIDLSEMLKLIRKFHEWEVQKCRAEFQTELTSVNGTNKESTELPRSRMLTDRQTRKALKRLEVRESSSSSSESDAGEDCNHGKRCKKANALMSLVKGPKKKKEKRYDIWAFIAVATRLYIKRRAYMKKTRGISPVELAKLKASFAEYDEDGSGEICDRELRSLLESLFPQLATSQESRPQLVRLLEEADSDRSGTLNFDDFLRLVNQCHDLRAKEVLQKEQRAICDTGFAPEEVQGFRELFMGDLERVLLSLNDLKNMMSSVVPLGHKNSLQLESVFKTLASETDAGLRADFADFLRIMRHLLDVNFAGLEEHARHAATRQT